MSTDFEAPAHVGLLSPKARMDTLDRVEDQVWAFDVDGTLIGSIRSDVLRPGAVELLRELAARGATTVIWSAGGAEYARRMAGRHGLDGHAAAFYGKERRGADGTFLIDHFEPEHRPTTFVDDQEADPPTAVEVLAVPQFFGGNAADRALLDLIDTLP